MKKSNLSAVKKFYLLDYFYVLLKSVEQYDNLKKIFKRFILLKQQYKLGESKYKKLTQEINEISRYQENRFYYTFTQVLYEAKLYKLINQKNDNIKLTSNGRKALSYYKENSPQKFYLFIFKFMEDNYSAFNYLITFFNRASKSSNGLIILPMYSPLKLNIERSSINKIIDFKNYLQCLYKRLETDIENLLKQKVDLSRANTELIKQLFSTTIMSDNNDIFNPIFYNIFLKRVRKFWHEYFLKQLYNFDYSLQTFETWTYRGKQIGLLHITEFFINFSGKLVYPISILKESTASNDFQKIFEYEKNSLFLHTPKWEKNKEEFLDALTSSYFQIKNKARSNFINIFELKELVCFKLRINEYTFKEFLEEAYHLNIQGQLQINISLEADKLPEETNAMYLKREPVLIDGKNRNIIAIDVTKRRR